MDVHIWRLITAICAPHSTVTCMYRATSMNHTRLIFVKMNFNGYYLLLGIRLSAYLAYTMLLKDNVTYLILCFVLFAKWRFAATIHPAWMKGYIEVSDNEHLLLLRWRVDYEWWWWGGGWMMTMMILNWYKFSLYLLTRPCDVLKLGIYPMRLEGEWIYLWRELSEVLIMKSEANTIVLLINFNR